MIEEPAAVFPLPAGEGQGEGERDVQPPSSSVRPANPTTVDQLRGRLEACPMLEEVLRVVGCWNPEAEATFAAREILRFVRDQRGRFRDCAVLLRSFAGYEDAVPRVFHRYQIPFFLDRRELVAHHPLAELTRFALRTVAFQWEHDDWFGALKTGLAEPDDAAIDRLENEALGRGWRGPVWFQPIRVAGDPALTEWIERIRRKIVPPFEELAKRLKLDRSTPPRGPTGAELAGALRELWNRLGVGKKLEDWTRKGSDPSPFAPRLSPIHQTVWTQMHDFLRDLELAFRDEPLPLTDWLPVVEAGLSRLTVGVVPPALDQVLVGVIDRSRNPDLQFAAVLGMNEGIFPAPPAPPVLLSQSDRDTLAALGAALGPDRRQQIGIERFYGYIACTRARRTLLLTFARRDAQGRDLNPSPFLDHLHSLFPGLASERFEGASDWRTAEHPSELIVPLLKLESGLKRRFADVGQASSLPPSGEFVTDSEAGKMSALPLEHALLEAVPQLKPVLERRRQVREAFALSRLSADLAERIYGRNILTSVSALEDFAACPFKFFAARGLRAEERIEFEVDHREKGSFQHEVLREFHRRVQADGKRWREVSPAEARRLARQIGEELLPAFREGLFLANQARRFAGRLLIEGLEQLMETLARWAVQYQFDPQAVEVSFGLKESVLPAWRIALDGTHALLLRGRIDRVDLCRIEGSAEALAVVIDYKSSARELDPVLVDHGLELQLLAYAGALSELEGLETELQAERLLPAGVFYVGLKGSGSSARTRRQERQEREIARHAGYQHRGRFDRGQLARFDNRGQPKGDQFKYAKNRDGSFSRRGNEALPTDEFQVLVAKVKALLRRHGCGIYSGQVEVAPYRWKQETACDFCAYRPVCRFDPWSQPYRVLRPPPKGQRA
ncbi:MAG: PD-(D/E)XK nuclease family protein [Verrucomicrobia bacterium]|nr:PD-(D/E)XK nuclease family protein [Verrucomicrobiota bacterium]